MGEVAVIGLDLAKSVFQVHGVNAEGHVVLRHRLSRGQVLKLLETFPACLVGMEVCASSHYWARELAALGHEVKLMPAQYVKPYVKRGKNDAADAEAICEAVTDSSQLKRAPDTKLIEEVMTRMCPWPSYAFKLDGTLLATNSALANLLRSASPDQDLWQTTASPTGPNIYDLVFHPTGLLRWMENPKEVLPETLRRLRIEASSDSALESTLKRIESYPSARSISLMNEIPPPVLVERYKVDTRAFSIISIISHLASPGEIELDHLRIESFVPADKASEAVISEITKPK